MRVLVCLVMLAFAFPVKAMDDSGIAESAHTPDRFNPLTLSEAIQIALDQNFSLRRDRNNLAIAESSLRVEEDRFGPLIDASFDESFREDMDETIQNSDFGLSLRQETTWGGSFSVQSGIERTDPDPMSGDELFSGSLGAQYLQPLLRGAGTTVATASRERARINMASSRRSLAIAEQRTVLSVTRAFFGVLRNKNLIEIQQNAVTTAEKNFAAAKVRQEEGLIITADSNRAELDLTNRRNGLLSAQQNYETALDQLRFVMGIDLETEIAVDEKIEAEFGEVDLESSLNEALESRYEILNSLEAIRSNEISQAERKNGYLPDIDLTLGIDAVQQGPSFSDGLDPEDPRWRTSLGVRYTFGNRADNEAYLQSLISGQILKDNHEELLREITNEVRDGVRSLESLRRRIEATKKGAELASYSLEVATEQFKEDLISTTDLLIRQEENVRAETDYLNVQIEYLIALVEFDFSLGRYGTIP